MKINILLLFSFCWMLVACTENIQLDLNSSNPQIVVEGSVSTNGKAQILITKSINFDQTNNFPALDNLEVRLTDNLGNTELLSGNSTGLYTSKNIIGMIGRKYTLSVKTVDKTITSVCTIPNLVKFDSLNLKANTGFSRGGFGGTTPTPIGTLYSLKVKFNDPANETNYYRFIEYKNGKSTGNIYIYDDRLNNGKTNEKSLFNFNRYLSKGDTVTVEMQCIDKTVYEYFNSFGNLGMGPSSSTPANPYTNLSGAVLGYFSAHTSERKSVIIK